MTEVVPDTFQVAHGMKLLGSDSHGAAWQDQLNGSVWFLPNYPKGAKPYELVDSEQLVGTKRWGELDWHNRLTPCAAVHDNMFNHWAFFLARGWTVEDMNDYFLNLCDTEIAQMRIEGAPDLEIAETWAEERAAQMLLNIFADAAFQAHMQSSAGTINDNDPERAKE